MFRWKGRVEPSGRLAAKGNNTLLAKDRSLRSEGLITSLSLMFLSHALSLSLSLYVSFSVSTYSSYLYPMYPLSLSLTGCLFSILCAILSPLCIVVSLFPPMSNVSFSLSSLSLCLITTYCVSLSLSSWWLLFYFLLSVVHIPSLTSMSYSPYLLNRFLSFFMYRSICLSFIWEQYIVYCNPHYNLNHFNISNRLSS